LEELKHNITLEVAKGLKDFTISSDMKLVLHCYYEIVDNGLGVSYNEFFLEAMV
jgi:hypothetical protein